MSKRIDLTGQRFGRLVVVSYNEEVSKQKKGSHWNCICDCGNETVVWAADLKRGNTQSCGCLNKENSSKKMKELNEKQWQDEEFRQMKSNKMRELVKQLWQDEEYRQMHSELSSKTLKQLWQDEEFRQMRSERVKEQWQDEEYRQMKSETSSQWLKDKWRDEEYRQMHSELSSKTMKKKWQDEEYRQMKINKAREQMKEMWQDEEFRQMQSDKLKEMWQDEEAKWKIGYKGGITPISKHLRSLNEEWFDSCKKEANYTCQLTRKHGGSLHTHHLYAFNSIVMDAHNTYNIEVKPQVKDYTEEELKLLEDYVAEWHKDSSNAVVLSEEAHTLFHQEYGYGGNTPEQFEEFRQRYINGEFKDLI